MLYAEVSTDVYLKQTMMKRTLCWITQWKECYFIKLVHNLHICHHEILYLSLLSRKQGKRDSLSWIEGSLICSGAFWWLFIWEICSQKILSGIPYASTLGFLFSKFQTYSNHFPDKSFKSVKKYHKSVYPHFYLSILTKKWGIRSTTSYFIHL